MRYKLSEVRLRALDEQLFDYRRVNHAIATRRLELEYDKSDEKRVGGKSGKISKRPEELVMKFDEDVLLKNLEIFKMTVEKLLTDLTKEELLIFRSRWLTDELSWPEIADRMFYSLQTIYRRREKILTKFAELKGELS